MENGDTNKFLSPPNNVNNLVTTGDKRLKKEKTQKNTNNQCPRL